MKKPAMVVKPAFCDFPGGPFGRALDELARVKKALSVATELAEDIEAEDEFSDIGEERRKLVKRFRRAMKVAK